MEPAVGVLPPKFDANDPQVQENPYPVYARLREAGRVCRAGAAQWGVTRYSDVAALLRDHRLGHEFGEMHHRFSTGEGAANIFFRNIILDHDPPGHEIFRQMMAAGFEPAALRKLSGRIEGLVNELLSPLMDQETFDAVRDLAFPLPVTVVCELLGVPAADRDHIRPRAINLSKAFSTHTSEEDRTAANEAVTWLRVYIGEIMNERKKHPQNDLLSHMISHNAAGRSLSYEEIVDNAIFLFFAGFETTMNLIATGCAALLDYPDQLQRLRNDRSLLPAAVEEFLRYDAPIQSTARLVLQPIQIGERTIRDGRIVVLLLGSANHDPAQFSEPERLDIGRKPNPHVTFGGGIHYCLGAGLARVEAAAVFGQLLQRFSVFEPAGKPTRRFSAAFRSYETLPIRIRVSGSAAAYST